MAAEIPTDDEYLVTPLKEDDVEQTSLLYAVIIEELHANDVWALQSYKKMFDRDRMRSITSEASGSYWTAKTREDAIGFGLGRAGGGVGFINWIGVESEHRTKGVGSAILATMERDFAKRECHKLELYTYQNNPVLLQFYEKRGYTVMANLNNHYYHLDVIYMTKDI